MENKNEFLALLTTAFQCEYNDVFLYLREAALFRRKIVDGERIAAAFEKFSQMELRHADRVSMKILEMGKIPRWEFKPLETEPSLHKVLQKHMSEEFAAYNLYGKLIEAADDHDFKIVLKGIREDEKEHLVKMRELLKKLPPARKP